MTPLNDKFSKLKILPSFSHSIQSFHLLPFAHLAGWSSECGTMQYRKKNELKNSILVLMWTELFFSFHLYVHILQPNPLYSNAFKKIVFYKWIASCTYFDWWRSSFVYDRHFDWNMKNRRFYSEIFSLFIFVLLSKWRDY